MKKFTTMLKKFTTMLTVFVLALAMNINTFANEAGKTTENLFAFDHRNKIVHVLDGNSDDFYTEFLSSISASRDIYMDSSESMNYFGNATEFIKENLKNYCGLQPSVINVFNSSKTTLYDELEKLLCKKNQSPYIMVTDLWNNSIEKIPSILPSAEMVFFVPFNSTDEDGVKHCEEVVLDMLNKYLPESSLYVVYLDKNIVKYTNILTDEDSWGIVNYIP